MQTKHKITNLKLHKKIDIMHVRVPNIPYSGLAVFVKAGSRFDPVNKEGLAHFFEHLLGVETMLYKKEERLKFLEKNGIDFYAETDNEMISIFHIQSKEKTLTSFNLLLDTIFSSKYTEKDLKRERSIIRNESSESYQEPYKRLWWEASKALWPESLLSRKVLGDAKTLNNIKLNDLKKFEKNYFKNNIKILVIEPENFGRRRAKLFEEVLKSHKIKTPIINRKYKYKDNVSKKPKHVIIKEDIKNNSVSLGFFFKTTNINDEKNVLLCGIIRDILGGSWISKLLKTLRMDRALTYWVNADTDYFSDTGVLEFTMSVDRKNLPEVLKASFKEFINLKKGLISNNELNDIKSSKVLSIKRSEVNQDFLFDWYRGANFHKKITTIDQYIKNLKSISQKDIMKAANRFLTKDNISVVALGVPKKDQRKIQNIIQEEIIKL